MRLSVVRSSVVVQGVLQEPSETMNMRLSGDSFDMSAVFELVLGGAGFYGL